MKNEQLRVIRLLIVTMLPLFTVTCVNSIQDETAEFTPGDVPIKISTNILCTQSRATNDKFEVNDAIGFYALVESQSIDHTRYIDNMRFTCTSTGLTPDEEVFYPAGNNKCDFISYYPYQENAIAANESSIKVAIKVNQSLLTEYSLSDFMTAKTTGVSSSNKSVKLDFQHKLCQLNIVLQLTESDNLQEIKENATVSINSAYTKATYNFNTNAFSSLSTTQDITPNGEWVINTDTKKLTGKKILLIPQSATKCKISLRINGRTFSSSLPDELILSSNTSSEIILHYDSRTGLGKLEPTICEWQEGNSKDVTLDEEEKTNSIRIADLNFEQTGVHQIITESNSVIAEVCREYLLSSNIDDQAIVLYPASTKNQGIVLQLLNTSGNVHGGSITWNANSNSFTYTPGNSAPIMTLYVDSDGNIVFEEPANPQIIITTGNKLNDIRGTETSYYPIIKMGTQYWMGENLKATKYNNGSAIAPITDLTKTSAGYFLNGTNLFYNKEAIVKGSLAPIGWKIPNSAEWEILKKYVNNVSSVLKAGTQWTSSTGISKANNRTGFNAQPIGFFNRKESKGTISSGYNFGGKYVAYWSTENSETSLSEKAICIQFDNNTVGEASYNEYSGYSIRCIKE